VSHRGRLFDAMRHTDCRGMMCLGLVGFDWVRKEVVITANKGVLGFGGEFRGTHECCLRRAGEQPSPLNVSVDETKPIPFSDIRNPDSSALADGELVSIGHCHNFVIPYGRCRIRANVL
jgi:hypothetical protein